MSDSALWATIHDERAALATDLSDLDGTQWSTPSLCAGWSVHEVLGHLTATANMTSGAFFAGLLGAGLRFNKMSAKNVARETSGTPADTLAAFRRTLTSTAHPPGPLPTWLGETIVHSEDIRRPLGLVHDYPTEALTQVADFYKGSNLLLHSKSRIAGLTLTATDTTWSTGSGPEVRGPLLSLVLAMTGRRAALEDLSGEGLGTLRDREEPAGSE
ncbi:MAG: maleylpyruvate isomerase family mycothiol-dependent enzyme [Actinomycetes bacterium]